MTYRVNWRRNAALASLLGCALLALPQAVLAGAQVEEQLAPSVVMGLHTAIADNPAPADYASRVDVQAWLATMASRMTNRITDPAERRDFLATVHYEATRAGLDPQLVLGVIHHESNFRKYAVSSADARGYMQVMPFWVRLIGSSGQNLFQLRTNLRYGCTILRHYLDMEGGDVYRALGRYNGSLGRAEYPTAVMSAVQRYRIDAPVASVSALGALASH